MKKLLIVVLALSLTACLPRLAQAQVLNLIPLGYQQLTSLGSATALTPISGSKQALVICTGQTVYWRDDGTDPTATIGMPLPINTPLVYTGALARIKFIQASASAVCNITYYQ